jgi:flagellar assembly protein FliH
LSNHTVHVKKRVRNIRYASWGDKANASSNLANHWASRQTARKYRSIEDMEKECQERCESAYRYGYEDGKKIGVQEGRDEIKNSLTFLNDTANKLMEKRDIIFKDAEQMIVQLAIAVAGTILRQEVKVNADLVRKLARESLRLVEDKKRVSIKVNPTDWDAIRGFEEEILSSVHGVKEWEIKEDHRITPGGCIIETDAGIIDAQLETQLAEIGATLMETV